jgi:hypothetical protein
MSNYNTRKKREKLYTQTQDALKRNGSLSAEALYYIQLYIQKTYGRTAI